MIYLILGCLVLLVVFLLSMQAKRLTARGMRLTVFAGIFVLAIAALGVLVVSGRYGLAAPAGAFALWAMRAYLLARQIKARNPPSAKAQMTRTEALDILGLSETASKDDIEQAYKGLMVKNHPDQGGTDWLAAQLNEARDTLLD